MAIFLVIFLLMINELAPIRQVCDDKYNKIILHTRADSIQTQDFVFDFVKQPMTSISLCSCVNAEVCQQPSTITSKPLQVSRVTRLSVCVCVCVS